MSLINPVEYESLVKIVKSKEINQEKLILFKKIIEKIMHSEDRDVYYTFLRIVKERILPEEVNTIFLGMLLGIVNSMLEIEKDNEFNNLRKEVIKKITYKFNKQEKGLTETRKNIKWTTEKPPIIS